MITRTMTELLRERMFKGKALILIGARQVGKTTLLKELLSERTDVQWFNADDIEVRTLFENITTERYRSILGNAKIVAIDEAQRIKNIGIKAKLLTDQFPEKQLILTGSSSFELANQINEPLTGRKFEYELFPISVDEMVVSGNLFSEYQKLPIRLVYGMYPEVICNSGNEREILMQLTNSYLYKDILEWERIKKPDKLVKLLQALAYQVGSEVSLSELGRLIELDKITIDKYICLLEQIRIIFRLPSFSRNLRNELKASKKIYFCDNGVRNALISNFSDITMRTDIGALWENFLISERRKFNHYHQNYCNTFFWRTTQQQEIDYLEEKDGHLFAYEFKWNPKRKTKISATFANTYSEHSWKTISQDNYQEFLIENE